MNSRGSWEGISNASPAESSCCVYELLCKTDFSLRMLISSWLSSLCEAITLPNPKHTNLFSFNTAQHTGINTVLLSVWTADYRSETETMMITVQEHLRRKAFTCVSVRPSNQPPRGAWQVQEVRAFWILSRGTGQDITPSDPEHCPLRTGKMPAFCL